MANFEYDGKDLEMMGTAKHYNSWIMSLFRPFIGKRVAEVGAGNGNFSEVLLKEPIEELIAVEPSSTVYAMLQERLAQDARVVAEQGYFGDLCGKYAEHFDSAVYINVLEHVEDDAAELARVYAALRPGGHVCIFVPALPWLYSRHDARIGHHRRYTKRQLVKRLENAGFEIVRARYFDIIGILPWFFYVKLAGKSPGTDGISLYDSVVVPIARMFESIISPPVGKNVVAVGRKPL
jgi:SAM-dependent methyltransferase